DQLAAPQLLLLDLARGQVDLVRVASQLGQHLVAGAFDQRVLDDEARHSVHDVRGDDEHADHLHESHPSGLISQRTSAFSGVRPITSTRLVETPVTVTEPSSLLTSEAPTRWSCSSQRGGEVSSSC